jgi:hypothetical protein
MSLCCAVCAVLSLVVLKEGAGWGWGGVEGKEGVANTADFAEIMGVDGYKHHMNSPA